MTQEEKIKEIDTQDFKNMFMAILVAHANKGETETILTYKRMLQLVDRWHTSELNRKMQEVVRVYADKIKADINNGVEYNKKNYNRDEITKEQIFAYLDHWLHDLKALLNVVNADD